MPDEPIKKRDALGRILPGTVLNPYGRAAMDMTVKQILAAACPKAAKALADALDAANEFGNPNHEVRIKAATAIMDRLYGKPHVSVSGEDGGPIQVDLGIAEMLSKLVD